jgi:glycosyltransferase involved in cell wall biosynthesis
MYPSPLARLGGLLGEVDGYIADCFAAKTSDGLISTRNDGHVSTYDCPKRNAFFPSKSMLHSCLMSDIALVHDALPFWGGAEQVLVSMLEIFPNTPVYTLLYNRARFRETPLENQDIRTSFVDRLPGVYKNHYRYASLFPLAIEQFDLRAYPVILSLNYAVAHGVLTGVEQVHLSYTYTPMRYAWQSYHTYLAGLKGLKKVFAPLILHYLRLWDIQAAARVDHFVAISHWVAGLIWRIYRRKAEVIYPPVDVDRYEPLYPRQDYYIAVSRMAPHKKVAMVVEAFSQLGLPLLVVGTGEEYDGVTARAASNVQLLGWQPPEKLPELLGRAKAFVHLAEDDFGIAPVEAQAAGCPVIALGRGGARETVIEGKTGVLFEDQSVEGVKRAVQLFEETKTIYDVREMRRNAERFSRARFQREMMEMVERERNRKKLSLWAKSNERDSHPETSF